MGKKKSGRTSAGTADKSSAADKTPRERKPVMERATTLATLAQKKLSALAKMLPLTSTTEAAAIELAACERISINMESAQSMVSQIVTDARALLAAGFVVKARAAGRKGLAEGDLVKIKEAKFDADMHGSDNNFKVLKISEKYVLIRSTYDETMQFPVLRGWLEPVTAT